MKWSVHCDGAWVDSGNEQTEDERDLMRRVLSREVGEFEVVPDKCYTVTAGELTGSSFGDEFERTGSMVGEEGEVEPESSGGFLFPAPVPDMEGEEEIDWNSDPVKQALKGIGREMVRGILGETMKDILERRPVDPTKRLGTLGDSVLNKGIQSCPADGSHCDMNDEEVHRSVVYPKCRKCGRVAAVPSRAIGMRMGTCGKPSDHVLSCVRRIELAAFVYTCGRCGKRQMVSDEATWAVSGAIDLEQMVREAMTS